MCVMCSIMNVIELPIYVSPEECSYVLDLGMYSMSMFFVFQGFGLEFVLVFGCLLVPTVDAGALLDHVPKSTYKGSEKSHSSCSKGPEKGFVQRLIHIGFTNKFLEDVFGDESSPESTRCVFRYLTCIPTCHI